MAKRGRPIGKVAGKSSKGKRISFALDSELYRPLAHHVIDIDSTIQQFVVDAIREKLAREGRRR